MNRLVLLVLTLLFQQTASAAIYKCERAGKVEYQATPCMEGKDISSKVAQPAPAATSPAAGATAPKEKKCVGKEVRIQFTDMPLKSTLQVLADFSGNKLVVDPAVKGGGAFSYDCVAWDTVLRDIASRHGLAISVESGTIFARKK